MRLYEDMAYGPAPIANSYWETTVRRPTCPSLSGFAECDTAIIGAGYTGLNAALGLARAGQNVVILDAQQPGWGASGRNGGFCCVGGSKISLKTLSGQVGREAALDYFRTERDAVGFVAQSLHDLAIDADVQLNGEIELAHSARMGAAMPAMADDYRALYGTEARFIPREALSEHGLNSDAFYGALASPLGFGLNPLKYALGLTRAALDLGVRLYGDSMVTQLSTAPDGRHVLSTSGCEVRARNLIIATNGYSSETLPPWLGSRFLPTPSAIIATRVMTTAELQDQGWTSHLMCFDSRTLLHYFRLLPDNRMLFGLRAATRTTQRTETATRRQARADFDRMFPAWRDVETEHYWSGLVSLARNRTPFAGPIPGLSRAWAALCYHGNGVAMGSLSGAMIAAQILQSGPATPNVMKRPLRQFELGRRRRALLSLAYGWYRFRDWIG